MRTGKDIWEAEGSLTHEGEVLFAYIGEVIPVTDFIKC